MSTQKRFACSDCGYEFYEVQNSIGGPESQLKCPQCGSANLYELDIWGLRKHNKPDWVFGQTDENDSNDKYE